MGKAIGRRRGDSGRAISSHHQRSGWRHPTIEALESRHMLSLAPVVTLPNDATIDDHLLEAGSFTDVDGSAWSGTVDYGDGSAVEPLVIAPNKSFSLEHTYGQEGEYSITVAITNNLNDTGSGTLVASVSNVAPTLTAIGNQTLAGPGLWSARDVGRFSDPSCGSERYTYVSVNESPALRAVVS